MKMSVFRLEVGVVDCNNLPIKSLALEPRNSPRIVTLVPGEPSLGDSPVTFGWGAIAVQIGFLFGRIHPKQIGPFLEALRIC